MSLRLDLGTIPAGLEIKTWGIHEVPSLVNWVKLGEYVISLPDFLVAAHYVLTNTDLQQDDPRLQFMKCMEAMKVVDGFMAGQRCLETTVPPVP